jgi:hypothetical protein
VIRREGTWGYNSDSNLRCEKTYREAGCFQAKGVCASAGP